jgi:16S rRNA (cytosine1402-N4)-methyltransferase
MTDHSEQYHIPVLLEETISFLITDKNSLYVDGTLGGGGHTSAILSKLESGGKLIAFDKDPDAIAHVKNKLSDFHQRSQPSSEKLDSGKPSLEVRHADYLEASSIEEISGLLLDLGVSSYQLDSGNRGISYRKNSRLDMRFGDTGRTAKDIITDSSQQEIYQILRNYGEEPFAGKISDKIFESRLSLETTSDLKELIESVTPKHLHAKTLSRCFQAFRIAVNDELVTLEDTLQKIVPNLKAGGRACIITYHSLEDRIVKSYFKELAGPRQHKNKYKKDDEVSPYSLLTPKPVLPTDEEIARNPRARSAKLRVIQKN